MVRGGKGERREVQGGEEREGDGREERGQGGEENRVRTRKVKR